MKEVDGEVIPRQRCHDWLQRMIDPSASVVFLARLAFSDEFGSFDADGGPRDATEGEGGDNVGRAEVAKGMLLSKVAMSVAIRDGSGCWGGEVIDIRDGHLEKGGHGGGQEVRRKAAREAIRQNVQYTRQMNDREVKLGKGENKTLDHGRRVIFGKDKCQRPAIGEESELNAI